MQNLGLLKTTGACPCIPEKMLVQSVELTQILGYHFACPLGAMESNPPDYARDQRIYRACKWNHAVVLKFSPRKVITHERGATVDHLTRVDCL